MFEQVGDGIAIPGDFSVNVSGFPSDVVSVALGYVRSFACSNLRFLFCQSKFVELFVYWSGVIA